MKNVPPVGTLSEQEFVVEPTHTIDFRKDGLGPVLSTPSLIWHLEHAAIAALAPFLDEGEISLGTEVDLAHLSPTPLHHKVYCRARVVHADGAKISFQIEAREEEELIARGTRSRFVVRASSFAQRLKGKLCPASPAP